MKQVRCWFAGYEDCGVKCYVPETEGAMPTMDILHAKVFFRKKDAMQAAYDTAPNPEVVLFLEKDSLGFKVFE